MTNLPSLASKSMRYYKESTPLIPEDTIQIDVRFNVVRFFSSKLEMECYNLPDRLIQEEIDNLEIFLGHPFKEIVYI